MNQLSSTEFPNPLAGLLRNRPDVVRGLQGRWYPGENGAMVWRPADTANCWLQSG